LAHSGGSFQSTQLNAVLMCSFLAVARVTHTAVCLSSCSHPLQVLSFRETISVPAGVTDAVLKCEVSFTADSGELARQVLTIHTGVAAGGCKQQQQQQQHVSLDMAVAST
jgi:hypothetical protein